jgi:hypothetical protein
MHFNPVASKVADVETSEVDANPAPFNMEQRNVAC